MTTLNISLSDELRHLADQQVVSGRYASLSEHVASLIQRDNERNERKRTERKLLDRVRSGPAKEMTDGDFDAIRQRLEGEIGRRKAPTP